MILATTIQDRLLKVVENPKTFCYDFDIRYLERWIKLYPKCFPMFVLCGNYKTEFVYNDRIKDFRYEFKKGIL
jgi:hypothetical protein